MKAAGGVLIIFAFAVWSFTCFWWGFREAERQAILSKHIQVHGNTYEVKFVGTYSMGGCNESHSN